MEYKIDLHAHADGCRWPKSWKNLAEFEYYSKGDPKEVILKAVERGLDGIAIVQQNNLSSSYQVFKLYKKLKKNHKIPDSFQVYIGEEVATPLGEFIAIGHEEGLGPYCPRNYKEFSVNDLCEAMDKVRDQGGVVIADHPFVSFRAPVKESTGANLGYLIFDSEIRERVSGIEVWNATVHGIARLPLPIIRKKFCEQIKKSYEACKELHLAPTAGSDNHSSDWIGLAYTLFNTQDIIHDLKNKATTVLSQYIQPTFWSYLAYAKYHLNISGLKDLAKNLLIRNF